MAEVGGRSLLLLQESSGGSVRPGPLRPPPPFTMVAAGTCAESRGRRHMRGDATSGLRDLSAERRACVGEEAAARCRIYLQQLESWKDLRVTAWQGLFGVLPPRGCSTPSRSMSPGTWDGIRLCNNGSSSMSLHTVGCSSLTSPTRGRSVLSSSINTRSQSAERATPHLPLEQYYEGEVQRALRRGLRMHEQTRLRLEEEERRLEMESMWDRLRETKLLLQESRMMQSNAMEQARLAEDRAHVLEAQVNALEETLKSVSSSSKELMSGLRLREEQVEVLSSEIQRLRTEKRALLKEHQVSEAQLRARVSDLQHLLDNAKQRESALSKTVDMPRPSPVRREDAPRGVGNQKSSFDAAEHKTSTGFSGFKQPEAAPGCEADKRHLEVEQKSNNLVESHTSVGQLQQCNEDTARALQEQVARYTTILAARDVSTAATVAQAESDLALHRRRLTELHEEWTRERADMNAHMIVMREEVSRLISEVQSLREGMMRKENECLELTRALCALQNNESKGESDVPKRCLWDSRRSLGTTRSCFGEMHEWRQHQNGRHEGPEKDLCKIQEQRGRSLVNGNEIWTTPHNALCGGQPSNSASDLRTCAHSPCSSPSLMAFGGEEGAKGGMEAFSSKQKQEQCGYHIFSTPQLMRRIDQRLGMHLQQIEVCIRSAESALLRAKECPVQQQREGVDTKGCLSPELQGRYSSFAVECAARLLEAVSVVSTVVLYLESISQKITADDDYRGLDRGLVQCLRDFQRSLHIVIQELERKGPAPENCTSPCVVAQDTLILSLAATLDEKIKLLLSMGEASGADRSPSCRFPPRSLCSCKRLNGECGAAPSLQESPLRKRTCSNGSLEKSLSRQTFAITGGRIGVSECRTRLWRLSLPHIVDSLSCSALGSLDHRDFLAAHRYSTSRSPAPPPCFSFVVRVGANCDDVLIGFADRQLPLEVFNPALNSFSYTNCYFLHLGRGTLYCPLYGLIDASYPTFSSRGPVQAGEEISCVLDTESRTVRFLRGDVDCGLAFEHVSLAQPLVPAFELNSRGCELELL
ncbi:hypothetical protein TRVL_07752 [Trypanosoma vivax]|nr:hypothetical protein TRVL_07752 [Trypanosoma vivax]